MTKTSSTKRKILSTLMAVSAASGLLLTSAGTADAQSGKRVCGHWFKAYPNNMEVVYFKFFKVGRSQTDECDRALQVTNDIGKKWGLTWKDRTGFEMKTCEWLGQWLYGKYGTDPCPQIKQYGMPDITSQNATGYWYDSRKANG